MVHVDCAADNPCIKLSIVLWGTYMVIMEVEQEQNKTKPNTHKTKKTKQNRTKQSMHAPSHQQSGPRIAHQAWSAASGTTAAI